MHYILRHIPFFLLGILGLAILSCSGSGELAQKDLGNFEPSRTDASEIVSQLPDYSNDLQTIRGKGRAIVSEPGNTERVTVLFSSNRDKSLVTVRNSIGFEGGQLLTDGDTLLVYNKVDEFAQKMPVRGSNLNRINRIASLNILDMINYVTTSENVKSVLESDAMYQLKLSSGADIFVDKDSHLIHQVVQPSNSDMPYSKITYDGYTSIEGFTLPRRISIFGAEEKSKVALQLTNLELNPTLDPLTIEIPEDTPVYKQ